MFIETNRRTFSDAKSENNGASYDVLLTDAALRQSLVTMRSLGRRGLAIAAFDTANHLSPPAFLSRWCRYKIACAANEGTPENLTRLEEALDSTGARVLITSSDGTIALVRQYRERLAQRVRIALACETALEIATNKELTLKIASQFGLAAPRAVTVRSGSEISAALHEIGLPAVVKPVESWAWDNENVEGMKMISQLVTTVDEAKRAVDNLTVFGGAVLFQQFLPGRREAISFFYAGGQMYARFAQWAKRTNPPLGGTSVLRQSIPVPEDIGEKAERLVREIDLEGYSEVEFRRDGNGIPYLMEINPRLSASLELAVHAGIDFPYLLYQWAAGERIDVVKGYHTGCWMRYLGGDIATTLAALKQRGRPGVPGAASTVLDFFLSFLKPMSYDYVNWNDPYPMFSAMFGFPRYLWQGGRRKSVKTWR